MAVTFSPGIMSFGRNAANAAKAVGGAFVTTGTKLFGVSAQGGGAVGSAAGTAARMGGSALDLSARGAGWLFKPITFVASRFPVLTSIGTVGAAGMMVRNHYAHKREDAVARADAQQQIRYMASTSPDEYALMMERMRGSAPAQPGFAAAEQARRDAAAQTQKG